MTTSKTPGFFTAFSFCSCFSTHHSVHLALNKHDKLFAQLKMTLKALLFCVLLCGAWSLEEKYKKLLLKLHNEHRANEGGSNMNELVWDDQLEAEATSWANGCVFEHEMKERGENLAFDSNKKPESELTESAFKSWFDEKNIYSYGQHSCGASCHYTQLVWSQTRRVGCGMKWCDYLTHGTANAWYLVCFYDPKGNMNGEKPYEKGAPCSKCRDDQTCKDKLCSGGSEPCEDSDDNCDMWANQMNQCTQNEKFMKTKCALSCKFCKGNGKQGGSGGGGGPCEDSNEGCSRWASQNQCQKNAAYMKTNCKKSCGHCGGSGEGKQGGSGEGKQGASKGGEEDKEKPEANTCEDKKRACKRWAKRKQCVRNPGYMKINCPKSCNTCNDGTECYDSHGNCRSWADRGECQRNPGWMHKYCKRSCGECPDTSSNESGNSGCNDSNGRCSSWAQTGECQKNPNYMNRNCKKSCNQC